jgi:hypothetical protein
MSAFDPDMFMNTQTTDANDTKFVPVPEGEFDAVIEAITPKTAGDKPVLDVKWAINDEGVKVATGLPNPSARQTIWLDLTEQGGLDSSKGKNIGLGKLREALGQNTPGQSWSPGMLIGRVARIKIGHRSGKEPGEVFADVKQVTAI